MKWTAAVTAFGIAAGLAIGLTACGGEDPDAVATTSLKAELLKTKAGGSKPTKDQAACIAKGMVAGIGVAALQDYGMLDEKYAVSDSIDKITLSADDARVLADTMVTCIDVEQRLEKSLLALTKKPSPKVAECVNAAVTKEAVAKILAQNFQRKPATAYPKLQQKVLDCSAKG